jgi:hypothetical protein
MNDENAPRREPGERGGRRRALRSLFRSCFVFSLSRVFVVPFLTHTGRSSILPLPPPLCLILLSAALGGCARSQSFRVVDARSGKPLEGVWVSQGAAGSGYTLRTDASGMVQFPKSGSIFSFAKSGYDETRVELKGSLAKVQRAADPQGSEVKRYGDLVQVILWRKSGPPDYSVESASAAGPLVPK